MRRLFLAAVLSLAPVWASADGFVVDHSCVDDRAIPQEQLDKARGLDVLFGHQSVGANLLEGLAALAEEDEARYSIEVRRPGSCGILPCWTEFYPA